MPDLTTFGKVIGGGLPIGAVGGRREIMETLTPLGTVFHAGTLAGNPIATAAGLAALDQLTPDVYIELMARARHLSACLRDACVRGRVPGPVPGRRHAGRHVLRRRPAARRLRRRQAHRRARLRRASSTRCSPRAWRWRPGAYEAIFVGLGHDDAVLDEIADRATRAAVVAAKQLG